MVYPIKLKSSESDSTALTTLAQKSISIDINCSLPHAELTKLYRSIENLLPDTKNRVVQFVSAYKSEDAHLIAYETAIVAAQMIGKRVLYIDTGASSEATAADLLEGIGVPLDTLILTGRPPQEAIAQASGTSLYFSRLRKRDEVSFPLASLEAIEMALSNLCGFFDLIVIDSESILNDAFGIALARIVDGSILVIESERTRAPVAAESQRMIEAGGGRVIGAVLSKRRFYIPRFLYRILYPHNKS